MYDILRNLVFVSSIQVGLVGFWTSLGSAQGAQGLDNPVLAYNLNVANDYQPGLQFLDLAKVMRPWSVRVEAGGPDVTLAELERAGHLDANGWIKSLPEGATSASTIFVWQDRGNDKSLYTGRYTLSYNGSGRVKVHLGANEVWSRAGTVVFENPDAATFMIFFNNADGVLANDYIRDVTIVAERNEALFAAGAMFNPDWIDTIKDARTLRFMDWMATNNSTISSWDQRPVPAAPNQGKGVPVEVMVRLANEVGAEPWFTMPHQADENYMRQFATYVRDHLDPALKVRVEYSNEVWNGGFAQARWVRDQALEEWGEDAPSDYFVKKAVETAQICTEVFGVEAQTRLVNVLGVQTVGTWRTQQLLQSEVWRTKEPDAYVDPARVFQELAATSYFGGWMIGSAAFQEELLDYIKDPTIDAYDVMAQKLLDPEFSGSIPQIAKFLRANAELAAQHGLKLSLYEGGQHIHQWYPDGLVSKSDEILIQDFLIGFVRSEQMGALYRALWQEWSQIGDGPFMQFGDIGLIGRPGSWGVRAGLRDETPRSRVLTELNDNLPWWATTGGPQFQHGVSMTGTRQNDRLVGTSQEDFFAGLSGDDVFVPYTGSDGVNGGDGVDRVILMRDQSYYEITPENAGYRVTSTENDLYLLDVEEIEFEDAAVMKLE